MAYDHIEKIEDTQSVSGFADRGMKRLKGLLQQSKTQSTERAEAPREAAPAREAEEPRQDTAVKVTTAPPPVNDTVTLGQHDEQDDNGMGWLSSLTQNYGV